MRMKCSKDAGFGHQLITTNPIESANAVIKRWTNFQPSDMCTFLDEMKDCVDEQRSNVKKAFLNLSSPYMVRPEYQHLVCTNYFQLEPAVREKRASKALQIRIDKKRYHQVMKYKIQTAVSSICLSDDEEGVTIADESHVDPFCALLPVFARSDIDAMQLKAAKIVSNNEIRPGFVPQQFIVKSSSSKYKTVSVYANNKIGCEKSCLGFNSRGLCSHTIAVAMFTNNIVPYITNYMNNQTSNLTKLTMSSVNAHAGMKGPTRKRGRTSSPDVLSMASQQQKQIKITLEDVLDLSQSADVVDSPQSSGFVVSQLSNSGLKMKIQSAKPRRPKYMETTTTPFELIAIQGNISKCAGCRKKLMDSADGVLRDINDKLVCIRHKEKDHVYIPAHNYWKPTFSNRHYHVFIDCVIGRNPSFNYKSIEVLVHVGEELKTLLQRRFSSL